MATAALSRAVARNIRMTATGKGARCLLRKRMGSLCPSQRATLIASLLVGRDWWWVYRVSRQVEITDSVGAGGLWNFSRDIHALTQSRYLALDMHFVVEHFNCPLKMVCQPIDCETNAHAILFI